MQHDVWQNRARPEPEISKRSIERTAADVAPQPIPTRYAGVLFRSRLEARWAVFFDHLDVKWEYEPQGFVSSGVPYLPDFAVFAALGIVWTEIKPSWANDPDGIDRFRKFAPMRPQPSRAALLVGPPHETKPSELVTLVIGGGEDDGWEDDCQEWRPCPSGHHFDLAYPGKFRSKLAEDGCPPDPGNPGEDRLADAVAAARSARFAGRAGSAA